MPYRGIDIARYPVGFDMRGSVDQEQFFIPCPGGLLECALGHIQRVGFGARHHQQRLINKIHIALRISSSRLLVV